MCIIIRHNHTVMICICSSFFRILQQLDYERWVKMFTKNQMCIIVRHNHTVMICICSSFFRILQQLDYERWVKMFTKNQMCIIVRHNHTVMICICCSFFRILQRLELWKTSENQTCIIITMIWKTSTWTTASCKIIETHFSTVFQVGTKDRCNSWKRVSDIFKLQLAISNVRLGRKLSGRSHEAFRKLRGQTEKKTWGRNDKWLELWRLLNLSLAVGKK
jgi:hypothetical protein